MKKYTGKEQVKVTVSKMKSIPLNENGYVNPFHHDASNMGTDLVRGWMVMHEGFDHRDEPSALSGMYLVNTRSGQRVRITFTPADQSVWWNRIKRAAFLVKYFFKYDLKYVPRRLKTRWINFKYDVRAAYNAHLLVNKVLGGRKEAV